MDEKEYNLKANQISQKIESKEELTKDEIKFFCEGTKFEYLSQFTFCEDYYYMRVFLSKRSDFSSGFVSLPKS